MSQRPASAPVAASTTAAGLRRASQRPRATGGSLRPGRRVARSSARDRSPERAARRNGRRGLLPGLVAARRPSGGGLTARGGSSAGSRTPGDSLRPGRTHRLRFPPRDPTAQLYATGSQLRITTSPRQPGRQRSPARARCHYRGPDRPQADTWRPKPPLQGVTIAAMVAAHVPADRYVLAVIAAVGRSVREWLFCTSADCGSLAGASRSRRGGALGLGARCLVFLPGRSGWRRSRL